ncbi:MAG: transporter substrate-binding domain-containing protein [Vicinamibacteria bacterium]|nr:transporter substrate-binding domain-containing protein [Vicinamibacteria bacterium]
MHHARGVLAGVIALAVAAPAAADWAEVKQRGALRVLYVYDEKRPEFFADKPGVAPGFDHEVLQGFASLHKLKLELVNVPTWDALLPALQAKKGDLVAGRFTVTESRRKLVEFTNEVFPTRNVVINRRPKPPVTTLEQLRAEKVGTIRGTSMAEAIAAAGVPASNVDDGLAAGSFGEALKSGRVSAAVWGVESAIALSREDADVQIGVFLGPPGSLAWAVRKGEPDLLRELNAYVDNVRRTQTWSRLVVKYFGEAGPEILKKARTP